MKDPTSYFSIILDTFLVKMSREQIQLVKMSPTDIESSSNRENLLIYHEMDLAERAEKFPEKLHQFKNCKQHQVVSFDLNLRKRVTIMDLVNAEITVGKFFLCRVLVPWVPGKDTEHSYTVVEDPEGKHGFQLNVSLPTHELRSEFMAAMNPGN